MYSPKNDTVPTIYDVAREAGVSRATVDRVIYKRGGVSQATQKRVAQVIEKLGYSANPNASRLASKKKFTIACLIPDFEEGEYWSIAYRGFIDGAKSIKEYNIKTEIYLFNQTDVNAFRAECEKILLSHPDGVITNRVFVEATKEFAAKLEEENIPYAFVDHKIDELDYLVYFGANPYESGRLGAFLLTCRQDVKDVAIVRLIRDTGQKADPNKVRRTGFTDYIEENYPDCKIHTIFIPTNYPDKTFEIMDAFFSEHPEVKHITMANSRIHLIADYLRSRPDTQRHVVGFDALQKNVQALEDGVVEFLVSRNIPQQSFNTIASLARYVSSGELPARRDNYVQIDILHSLNYRYYDMNISEDKS